MVRRLAQGSALKKGALLAVSLVFSARIGAQGVERATLLTMATLSGIVKDTLGHPLHDAEVLIPEIKRSVKTNTEGSFVLDSVAPGKHEVWIRDLGYIVV